MKIINKIQQLIKKNQGIKLDIGCGCNKQDGFIGMDIEQHGNVDIVHDIENIPYPLPNECCTHIIMSHILEHICPKKFFKVMNEVWRIMKVDGKLFVSVPYAGTQGFWQDPTHVHTFNEASFYYLDPNPKTLNGNPSPLYGFYKPKPWEYIDQTYDTLGNIELILKKRGVK